MKYMQKSFSSAPSSESYRDNFDRIFRQCTSELAYTVNGAACRCRLSRNHEGKHEAFIQRTAGCAVETVAW